jgi:hypothetical protein
MSSSDFRVVVVLFFNFAALAASVQYVKRDRLFRKIRPTNWSL